MSEPVYALAPRFWEFNPWEPSVQVALPDVCRYGDTVFDVGTHSAGLTVAMSRLVGPKGVVCSFEASLRNIETAHTNILAAGAFNTQLYFNNTQLYFNAVYKISGEVMTLYERGGGNDSLYEEYAEGTGSSVVESVAIDDFVTETGLRPSFVKIDIEGAEFDALLGAADLIARHPPSWILEQQNSDDRCFALLSERGYRAVDLANYKVVRTREAYEALNYLTNLLYLPPGVESPYLAETSDVVARIGREAFDISETGVILREPLALPAGRYLCKADFKAEGVDNSVLAGVLGPLGYVNTQHAYSAALASNYNVWPFSLRANSTGIRPFFTFQAGADATFEWTGVEIVRLPAFNAGNRRLLG